MIWMRFINIVLWVTLTYIMLSIHVIEIGDFNFVNKYWLKLLAL